MAVKLLLLFLASAFLLYSVQGQQAGQPTANPGVPPDILALCEDTTVRPPNVVCPTSIGGAGVSGVIAASSFPSCTAFEDELNCGSNQNVTVLDLGLSAGTGGSVTYEFSVVPTSGSQLQSVISGQCTSGDTCAVTETQKVRLTVTSSAVVTFYNLKFFLHVPYSYIPFHSNAYNYWGDDDNPDTCEPDDTTNTATPYVDSSLSSGGGVAFSQLANYFDTSYCDTSDSFDNCISSYTFIFPWVHCLTTENGDDDETGHGDCYALQTASGINQLQEYSDQSYQLGSVHPVPLTLCDMPSPNPSVGTSYMDTTSFDSTRDTGRRSAFCMYFNTDGTTAAFDLDSNVDRSGKNGYTCSQTDDDDCRQDSDQDCDVDSRRYQHCRIELDDDCQDSGSSQCTKKYQRINDNNVCRFYYGNHFYQGRIPSQESNFWNNNKFQRFEPGNSYPDYSAIGQHGMVGDVRPVCIGCGRGPTGFPQSANSLNAPYFSYGLPPVKPVGTNFAFSNSNGATGLNYFTPERLQSGNHIEDDDKTGLYAQPCGPDDESCCDGTIQAYQQAGSGTITKAVAQLVCKPGVDKSPETVNPQCIQQSEINNICPLCNYDRTGLISFGLAMHRTMDLVGILAPMNQVFEIDPLPNPAFSVTATLQAVNTDGSAGAVVSNVTVTNIETEFANPNNPTNYTNLIQKIDPNVLGKSKSDERHIMFVQITGIDTTTGRIGKELDGYIVIMNNTQCIKGHSCERVSQLFQGDVTQNGLDNPYISSSGQTRTNPFGLQKGGITPWPGFMDAYVNQNQGNPLGAWWYYVPPNKKNHYGTSCGQNGIETTYWGDLQNGQFLCRQVRYTCVPGFIPGFDWTYQDRINDTFHPEVLSNPSLRHARELNLRDSVEVHSPCQISGYFHQWMSESTSCSDFIDKYTEWGYLPEDWVSDTDNTNDQCNAPNYWVFGNKLVYANYNSNPDTLYIRIKVAIAGQLLDADQQVSGGCFSKTSALSTDPSNCLQPGQAVSTDDAQCAVIQNESGGSITVNVLNTGGITGDYIIYTECEQGSGISADANPVIELNKNSPSKIVTIPISHAGVIKPNSFCSLRLSNPQFTFVTFDNITQLPCQVASARSLSGSNLGTPSVDDVCAEYGLGCGQTDNTGSTSDDNVRTAIVISVAIFLLLLLTGCCIFVNCECQKDSVRAVRLRKDALAEKKELERIERKNQ